MQSAAETWEFEGTLQVPLLGSVAAGQPLEVFTVEETLDVPESLWNGKKIFALRVRGNSMIDAGINDGDYLIVEPRAEADNGRTVVAEVDGRVTVKKLFRDPRGQVRLQPANETMLPLIIRGDRVKIIGVVVGVLRKYGFGGKMPPRSRPAPRPAAAHPTPAPLMDEATFRLAVNAIDTALDQWRDAMTSAASKKGARTLATIAEVGRDLQALRDWCARTSKPGLRKALIAEANQLMMRMQRMLRKHALEADTFH